MRACMCVGTHRPAALTAWFPSPPAQSWAAKLQRLETTGINHLVHLKMNQISCNESLNIFSLHTAVRRLKKRGLKLKYTLISYCKIYIPTMLLTDYHLLLQAVYCLYLHTVDLIVIAMISVKIAFPSYFLKHISRPPKNIKKILEYTSS